MRSTPIYVAFALFALCTTAAANPTAVWTERGRSPEQALPDSLRMPTPTQIRANLLYDPASGGSSDGAERERSVALALGMSAVLPGLGQAYNRDWIRSAVAVALESGLVIGYIIWRSRGLDAERAYKAYAHRYWNPAQYAGWLNDYVAYLEQTGGMTLGVDPVIPPDGIDFSEPSAWSAAERQSVRTFFNAVRDVEDVVYHPETGAKFSHHLPYFGEQQYYELIGKYFQFAPGWVDYPAWREGDDFTEAIDPERTGSGGTKPNVQGRFLEYAEDHAYANTLLRRASRASAFILLNHIVAAFDAAVSAKLHNDRLDTSVRLGTDGFDRPQVSAALSWRM